MGPCEQWIPLDSFFGSEGWLFDNLVHAADSLAVSCLDFDVSMVAPGGTPRVLQDVIAASVVLSVADCKHFVVQLGATLVGIENTAGVGLEDEVGGIHEYNYWLVQQSSLDGLGGSLDFLDRVNLNLDFCSIEVASVLIRRSWVVLGALEAIGLSVLEHTLKLSCITTAIHVLLSRNIKKQLSRINHLSSGKSINFCKRDWHLSTIVDWTNGPFTPPIHLVRQLHLLKPCFNSLYLLNPLIQTSPTVRQHSSVLINRISREDVVRQLEGGLRLIHFIDLSVVLSKDLESKGAFLRCSVPYTEVLNMLIELLD